MRKDIAVYIIQENFKNDSLKNLLPSLSIFIMYVQKKTIGYSMRNMIQLLCRCIHERYVMRIIFFNYPIHDIFLPFSHVSLSVIYKHTNTCTYEYSFAQWMNNSRAFHSIIIYNKYKINFSVLLCIAHISILLTIVNNCLSFKYKKCIHSSYR